METTIIPLEEDTGPPTKVGFEVIYSTFQGVKLEGCAFRFSISRVKEVLMKIAIGTKNKAKNKAVQNVCRLLINDPEFIMIDVPSNVSNQPFGDEETLQGAKNRAIQACKEAQVNLAFGLEGGVKDLDGQLFICNWGVLQTKEGKQYMAGGAQLPLPEEVALAIRSGEELGPIMERYTKQEGVRHNEGAVGVFTSGIVKRADMFEHIIKLLLGQYFQDHPNRKMT